MFHVETQIPQNAGVQINTNKLKTQEQKQKIPKLCNR